MGEGRDGSVGKCPFCSHTKELLGWSWRRLERPEAVLWVPQTLKLRATQQVRTGLGQACTLDLATPSPQGAG